MESDFLLKLLTTLGDLRIILLISITLVFFALRSLIKKSNYLLPISQISLTYFVAYLLAFRGFYETPSSGGDLSSLSIALFLPIYLILQVPILLSALKHLKNKSLPLPYVFFIFMFAVLGVLTFSSMLIKGKELYTPLYNYKISLIKERVTFKDVVFSESSNKDEFIVKFKISNKSGVLIEVDPYINLSGNGNFSNNDLYCLEQTISFPPIVSVLVNSDNLEHIYKCSSSYDFQKLFGVQLRFLVSELSNSNVMAVL